MCNFRVGQKVVCKRVALSGRVKKLRFQCPLVGAVYTIRAINDWGGDKVLLRFHGLDNSHLTGVLFGDMEPGFHYSFFAPIAKRPTDISIFRALLNTTPETVGA